MSDLNQATPTLQKVKHEAEILVLCFGHEAVRELYGHFGAKSADDLAETDRREFIRLAKMSCEDRAEVVGSKPAPPPIAVELNRNTTITMRDKAVALAKMGFRVFPLKAGTKDVLIHPHNKPKPPKSEYHQHIPSSDPADVAAMWTGANNKALNYNIGINTDDLLVIDVDNKHGKNGDLSLQQLVMENGLELTTVEARTPAGGRHLFYKLPKGLSVKNTASKLAPGIDTRGHHGFVVGAGSVVPKGEYQWVRAPGTVAMADAPEAIVRACAALKREDGKRPAVMPGVELDTPEAVELAKAWLEQDAPEVVWGAGGDHGTICVANTLGDFGISLETAQILMADHWNHTKAHPPWPLEMLDQKIANAYASRQEPIGIASAAGQFEAVEVENGPRAKGDETGPLPFINIADWDTKPVPERLWAVENRIPLLQAYYFGGNGSVGKSLVELMRMTAHVLGKPWLGMPVRQGPAIYLGAEDDQDELHRRLTAILFYYGATFADVAKGGLHLLSYVGEDCFLGVPDKNGIIRPTALWTRLEQAAMDIKPVAISIDTVADVFGGHEIDRGQVTGFVKMLQGTAQRARCSVGLLAHPSVAGMSSGSGLSGSTAWHNKMRARAYMRAAESQKGQEIDSDLREIEFKKNNYGPQGDTIQVRWKNGVFVPECAPTGVEKVAQDHQDDQDFLTLLVKLAAQGRKVTNTPNANNYAPKALEREAVEGAEAGTFGVLSRPCFACSRPIKSTLRNTGHHPSGIAACEQE